MSVLDQLSEFVVWRGRYRMPQSHEAFKAGKAVTAAFAYEANELPGCSTPR